MGKKPENSKSQRKLKVLRSQKCQIKPKQPKLTELTEMPI